MARRLVIWKGPPPEDLAQNTGLLVQLCREAGASHVFVDSLKDAAVGLSEDVVGAGYNRARQAALAEGVQVAELHHQVKQRKDGVSGIDAVYGSTWITAGAGSVVHLDGAPGDPVVTFRHLKQPADTVGPFDVLHDQATGMSQVVDDADPVALAQANGGMITVPDFARVLFATDKPSRNETEKARRKLERLAGKGHLHKRAGTLDSGADGPTVYALTEAS